MEAPRRERHQVLRLIALGLAVSCGCTSPKVVPITEARPTTTITAPATSSVCRRFERDPIDLGIEHASSIAISGGDTCAVSDGKLVCVAQTHGAVPTMRLQDATHAAGSSSGRRVCALRSDAKLECSDGEKRFDFSYLERTSADMLRHATNLVLDQDIVTLVLDDGSLRNVKIDVGTDARGQSVYVAFPSGAPREKPVRAVTIAHQFGGSAQCILVDDHEVCSSWRLHQTMEMPGPVAAIGGHCALLEDGRVACFTVRTFELGTPVVVATVNDAAAIASDDGQGGCAVTREGRWACFGDLGAVFGVSGMRPLEHPRIIAMPEPVTEVAMNEGVACARTKSGRVACFGCLERVGL